MIAIILAAGDSIFWKWETRKHLFSLGKEKIIKRLQRQLEDRKINYVVITDDINVMAESKNAFIPPTFNSIIDTLSSSKKTWEEHDRVIILMGDTIYSKNSLDKVLSYNGHTGFFGKYVGSLREEVLAVSTDKANEIHQVSNSGDMLDYYWLSRSEPMFILGDYTTNICTYEQYRDFISSVVNAGKLDDTLRD